MTNEATVAVEQTVTVGGLTTVTTRVEASGWTCLVGGAVSCAAMARELLRLMMPSEDGERHVESYVSEGEVSEGEADAYAAAAQGAKEGARS